MTSPFKIIVVFHYLESTGTEEEIMMQFRNVRDAIKARIETFVQQGK
ncbi:hypothetical protein [Paenibacillus macerans]